MTAAKRRQYLASFNEDAVTGKKGEARQLASSVAGCRMYYVTLVSA